MSRTAVARIAPAAPVAVAAPMDDAVSFPALVQMGQHLVGTGFLPDHIKNGPQAAAIILAGRELGMPPMRALRSLVLVKGKVTEYADSQLSRFKADGGHAKFTELSAERAVLWLKHPNGDEHTETFTMQDAKNAGLTGSGMYAKFGKAMLRSRAITAGLKSIGWEGGAGVYDPSELDAPQPAPVEVRDVSDMVEAEEADAGPPMPATLAACEDVTLPGGPKAWGGKGGKRLADLSDSLLRSVVEWVGKDADRAARYADVAFAADAILADRANQAETTAQLAAEGNVDEVAA